MTLKPKKTPLSIIDLQQCPEHLQTLACWHQQAWPKETLARRVERLQSHIADVDLPTTMIALQDERLVGSASLVRYRRFGGYHNSAWLTNVFVAEGCRRQGLGRELIEKIVSLAESLNMPKLYLQTTDKQSYYESLGWKLLQEHVFKEQVSTIMTRSLSKPNNKKNITLSHCADTGASKMTELRNSLSQESSPYLQLHRQQRVAWQVWSKETLQIARESKKPILLSIGYSTCHWCHAMSSECFSDELLAAQMNRDFINIKVDREERPDLDQVYQLSHQMLNGRPGGWPLHAFLCPETTLPFFVGTYFPLKTEGSSLGFEDLLLRVKHYYHQQKPEFKSLIKQVEQSFEILSQVRPADEPDVPKSFWAVALEKLMSQKDEKNGGFCATPKFPMAVNLSFLLASQIQGKASEEDRHHLHNTLKIMAERGINDRIGGGFFRYGTDAEWRIPHFEKMLYDNGLLMDVYATAWRVNPNPLYKSALFGVLRWLKQFMLSEYGAFFSALDADSDEHEGGFYLASSEEIRSHLDKEEYELFRIMFGLDGVQTSAHGWHFSQQQDLASAARAMMITRESALELYRQGREKIEEMRIHKTLPRVDHKILTSWNSLVIKGLAAAVRVDGEPKNLLLAQQALNFVRKNLWVNQRLFASWQKSQPKGHALLDDYVYLMDAILEMLQVQWRDEDFHFLTGLAESLLTNFQDDANGGFFYTPHDHEKLVFRSKPFVDTELPAPNGVAARVFLRLGTLAGEPRYQKVAKNTLLAGHTSMSQFPENHLSMVQAWEEYMRPLPQVLLVDDGAMTSWQTDIESNFWGRVLCFRIPSWAESQPPEMLGMEKGEAVVCYGDHHVSALKSRNGLVAELTKFVGAGLE